MMICKNCSFKNREGIIFCEECGQRLKEEISPICPSCNYKNREGVAFCEDCGTKLAAGVPAGNTTPRRKKKPAPRVKRTVPAPPSMQPAPPPVVVQVQAENNKRRLNPLWLILLLLLLVVSCCCLLLLFEQVEVPDFAAPYLDPIIEDLHNRIPNIGENNGQTEAPTCEEFKDILQNADLGQVTTCKRSANECYTDIHDIEFYDGLKLSYRWGTGFRKDAACEEMNGFIRCYFPKNTKEDKVSYWIKIDRCVEELGYSEGWLDGEDEEEQKEQDVEQEKPVEMDCCNVIDSGAIEYLNPTVTRNLHIELYCDQPWDLEPGECISGDAWIGADLDIHWTEMVCCVGDDPIMLDCISPGTVDQKKSKTKLEFNNGQCEWEVEFQSPYYAPKCPPGQSMCAGSCCSIGHCCNCGSGTGCYQSCSGCTY